MEKESLGVCEAYGVEKGIDEALTSDVKEVAGREALEGDAWE